LRYGYARRASRRESRQPKGLTYLVERFPVGDAKGNYVSFAQLKQAKGDRRPFGKEEGVWPQRGAGPPTVAFSVPTVALGTGEARPRRADKFIYTK
jgi:hypothetical protein